MANRYKGEIAFTAAGKSYTICYSTNALCELEDLTGRGFTDILLEFQSWGPKTDKDGVPVPETQEQTETRAKRIRLSLVRAVFCAGLRDRQPETTLKLAGDLMAEVGGMMQAMDLINQAFAAIFPDEEKPARPLKPDSPAKVADGTGSAS